MFYVPNLNPVNETHTVTLTRFEENGRAAITIDGKPFYGLGGETGMIADYGEIKKLAQGYPDAAQYSQVWEAADASGQTVWQGYGVLQMGCARAWEYGFPTGPLGSFYYVEVSPEDFSFYTGLAPENYPAGMLAVQIITTGNGIALRDYLGEKVTFTGDIIEAHTAHHRCPALVNVTQISVQEDDGGGYINTSLSNLGKNPGGYPVADLRAGVGGNCAVRL